MKVEEDELVFSTGRRFYANKGIVGLSPNLEISEGYDGGIEDKWCEPPRVLTRAEKVELADYMIALWTEYRVRELEGK
jgi:hypothetical protein